MGLIANADPKRPTTKFGWLFIIIAAAMIVVKYIVPVFYTPKEEIPYEWYIPGAVCLLGVFLVFLNEEYFSRIFSRVDKAAAKKTDTTE